MKGPKPKVEATVDHWQGVEKIRRDLLKALRSGERELTPEKVRYCVDLYYQLQHFRQQAANQLRSGGPGEPDEFIDYAFHQFKIIEHEIRKEMDAWTDSPKRPEAKWSKSVYGIGPVISAGLSAHIDINKAPTVGHIWRFGGFDPSVKWEKGQKRPWNARLKVLFWKIGDSFCKFHNKPKCIYGHLYAQRKALEVQRNDSLAFKELAAETLKTKKFKDQKTREIYESGKLPDGRLELRARRWATKIFLSHWHAQAYRLILGKEPPKPFAIAILGHAHMIEPETESFDSDEEAE